MDDSFGPLFMECVVFSALSKTNDPIASPMGSKTSYGAISYHRFKTPKWRGDFMLLVRIEVITW